MNHARPLAPPYLSDGSVRGRDPAPSVLLQPLRPRPRLEARHVVGRDLVRPGQRGLGIQAAHKLFDLAHRGM
jgi:hypothetical protein